MSVMITQFDEPSDISLKWPRKHDVLGAGILYIGLGCAKQHQFAVRYRNRIPPVMICVGAGFDFHAGTKAVAPAWMQRRGLEWLFRPVQEPGHLWKRYLVTNSFSVARITAQFVRQLLSNTSLRSDERAPNVATQKN